MRDKFPYETPYGLTPWPEADGDAPSPGIEPARPPAPEVYSLREVAKIFGRSERTIRTWVRAGRLQRGGFGNAVFFTRKAIDALLNGENI